MKREHSEKYNSYLIGGDGDKFSLPEREAGGGIVVQIAHAGDIVAANYPNSWDVLVHGRQEHLQTESTAPLNEGRRQRETEASAYRSGISLSSRRTYIMYVHNGSSGLCAMKMYVSMSRGREYPLRREGDVYARTHARTHIQTRGRAYIKSKDKK
jgi:hypothetical protein